MVEAKDACHENKLPDTMLSKESRWIVDMIPQFQVIVTLQDPTQTGTGKIIDTLKMLDYNPNTYKR